MGRARVIGYIPLEGRKAKTRSNMSKLLDVTRAKNDGDRLKKLVVAVEAFNHSDIKKHNSDVKAGAFSIVCSILRSCMPFLIGNSKEIRIILKILLQLLTCSDDRLCASFCTDGTSLTLDLLELIEINYRLGKKGDPKSLVLAQHVVEKLMVGVRVPLVMVKQQEELLLSLVNNMNGCTGRFAMHLSMRVIARLSEHNQNKQAMFVFPELVDSVESASLHIYEEVRDEAARIIRNLAMGVNRCHLGWLDTVVTLASSRSGASRAYAIQAIGYLASCPENKASIVQYKNGLVVGTLLQVALSRIAQAQVSINSTKVLGSLVSQSTAVQIGLRPGLLVSLSSLACRDDKLAIIASIVVKKLANHIRPADQGYEDLLQALLSMSYGTSTEVLKWTVKGYLEQASSPDSRVAMIAHKGLLGSLVMLADDKNSFVREYASEVLSLLASDVASAKNMRVESVLRCVTVAQSNEPGAHRKRQETRCYSPASVAHFDFDFAAYF